MADSSDLVWSYLISHIDQFDLHKSNVSMKRVFSSGIPHDKYPFYYIPRANELCKTGALNALIYVQ